MAKFVNWSAFLQIAVPLVENKFETNVEPVSTIEEIKDRACLDNELPQWGPKSLKIILQKPRKEIFKR